MSSFRPSGYSGPLTAETASWDFFEADVAERAAPIPFVGSGLSQSNLYPGRHAAAKVQQDRAAAIQRLEATSPGLAPLPVGDKEMVLVTSGQEATSSLRPEPKPFYEKEWFWPVALFGVVMGFVSSTRRR